MTAMFMVSAVGALGAYYRTDQVRVLSGPDSTSVYLRAARRLEFHRCKVCNLTTRWVNVDLTNGKRGVNARLITPEARSALDFSGGM